MATMRDIAKRAGVSLASASRILSGDTEFKVMEATRKRVLEAADALGYKYAPRKRGAGIRRIGCILSYTADSFSDKYFYGILSAASEALQHSDCLISSYFRHSLPDVGEICRSVEREELSGLIVLDDTLSRDYITALKKLVQVVGIDTDFEDVDNVGYDHNLAGRLAMEYLVSRGHSRIASIGGTDYGIRGRAGAYKAVMHENGFDIPRGYALNCGWSPELCFELTLELLKSSPRPTAIFAHSDNLALAVLRAVNELHLSCPDDVAVMGINNLNFTAFSSPPLTTVEIPMHEIGAFSAELLLRRIGGYDTLPFKTLFPTRLIVRNSV